MKEIDRNYRVEGLLYGKKESPSVPFSVRKGEKALALRYGLRGVPALVVLKSGELKQKLVGQRDIGDAAFFIDAFNKGALSVSEAAARAPGGEIVIVGWVSHKGRNSDGVAGFFITDKTSEIPLTPWLPTEAAKETFRKKGIRMMADVIGRPVKLRGELRKRDARLQFSVEKELKQ